MSELIDTGPRFSIIPEGEQVLTILEVPLKKRTKKGDNFIYEFKFGYVADGQKKKWTAFFMPWDLGLILSAMKFTQVSEHTYDWDREQCLNRVLKVKIVHQPDSNDPKKVWPRIFEATELPF